LPGIIGRKKGKKESARTPRFPPANTQASNLLTAFVGEEIKAGRASACLDFQPDMEKEDRLKPVLLWTGF
jgi:hypothetical protein